MLRVYMMADKYDIPVVRIAAVKEVRDFLYDLYGSIPDEDESVFDVPDWIAKICGPDAPQLADPTLRELLFSWVSQRFDKLMQDPDFSAKIEDGSLLDAELTAELLSHLGAEISHLKKKTSKRKT